MEEFLNREMRGPPQRGDYVTSPPAEDSCRNSFVIASR
jgi:hypothetical protein